MKVRALKFSSLNNNNLYLYLVLLSIFSYLDDLSLWNVSEVCKQWRNIIETHTGQKMWKKYTRERWPLVQILASVSDWFNVNNERNKKQK